MSASPEADVAVIGAGLIGCSIAWRLAQAGLRVVVLERAQPGAGASWAAAGWLSPSGEASQHAAFHALARASRSRYEAFVAEAAEASGVAIEFGAPGGLDVSQQPAVWHADDAFVDNRQLTEAVVRAARAAGAHFRSGVTVGSVTELEAARVVVAAGAWSGQLAGLPRPIPVAPVKGQMLSIRAARPIDHIIHSSECYLVPRSGSRVLVGATVERVGFEAGLKEAALTALRAAAVRAAPQLAEHELVDAWFGFRPGTPDDLPILGPDRAQPRIVYATGHYRNGILLAPITAELISRYLLRDEYQSAFDDFGIERFTQAEPR